MEDIVLFCLIFLIFGVCVPIFYKNRFKDNVSKGDIVFDSYWSNMLILFLIIHLIYTTDFNDTIILILFLIVWVVYKLLLRSDKGKELEKNPNFYKVLAVLGPFAGIILELYIFLTKHFGPIMFVKNELQFKIFSVLSILLLIWTLYFSTKSIISFIFKDKDVFRKVFIVGEVILVLIYASFTIYYIFNTNLLTFYFSN